MKLNYESAGDANMYLSETIVQYDGKPFRILRVDGDMEVAGHYLNSDDMIRFDIRDDKLDMTPPQLGYVNTQWGARYLVRRPLRSVKQGIHVARLMVKGGGRLEGVRNQELYDSFSNIYPSLATIVTPRRSRATNPFARAAAPREEGPREKDSTAFSRHFAVNIRNQLLYKGRPVGEVVEGVPTLTEEFMWLTEALEGLREV